MTTSAQPFGTRSGETLIAFDGASGEVPFLGRIYRGYALSPVGSVVGGVGAFVDGGAGGAGFAWLYNAFTGRSTSAAGPEARPAGPGREDRLGRS